ncbi:MAG: PorV/PorQ family protein [Candidatus Poribacteria bacterium]|nr:PorV/PorQ family protein [Candidatus Poribacteria bacterium]
MRTPLRSVLALMLLICAQGAHAADEGSYALEFLTVGVGARAMAMGGAHVAEVGDATAAYWNPAGLTDVPVRGFSAQHADTFQTGGGSVLNRGMAQYNFLNVVLPFGDNSSKIAVSWVRLGVDDIPRVTFEDVNGDGILGTFRDVNLNGVKDPGEYYIDRAVVAETFSNSDDALLVSYARPFGDALSVGGNFKVVRQAIYNNTGTGFGFDLGATYRVNEYLRAAFVVQDAVGTRVRWNTDARPTFVRDPNPRLGVSGRLPLGGIARLTGTADVDLNRTTALTEEDGDGSRWHFGGELTLLKTVSFRVGSDTGEFTAGAGFRIPVNAVEIHVDYAFTQHPDWGDTSRLSLSGTF